MYGALMRQLFTFCDCEQPLKMQMFLSLQKPSPFKFNLCEKNYFLKNNLQIKPHSFKRMKSQLLGKLSQNENGRCSHMAK